MKFRYFIETENRRIYDKDFERNGLVLECVESMTDGGCLYNFLIINKGKHSLFLEKFGAETEHPDVPGATAVFIDPGKCAWAGVKRIDFFEDDPRMQVIHEQRVNDSKTELIEFHRSDLQTVVYSPEKSILVGFTKQVRGENYIDIHTSADGKTVDLLVARQSLGKELYPGDTLSTDDLFVAVGQNPYVLLENYALAVNRGIKKTFDDPPVTGMMTWYGYHASVTEDIVQENAILIKDLFDGYPQESAILMLVDHGWQCEAEWGLLKSDNERFPNGMRQLAVSLKKIGVELGIWHTPFCITEYTGNYNELKPHMAKNLNGIPLEGKASVWSTFVYKDRGGSRKLNYFDGSKPEVQKRWKTELKTLREWGAVYCKMDFFALYCGETEEKSISRGELYTESWKSFREGFGSDGHLAPCSCDTNMQLGYCDSIRIASDIGEAGTWPGASEGYMFGHSTIASMWYKNRKFWINDADSVQVSKGCSMGEARVRATTVALSGGHLMLSEDLRNISHDRLEIIRRILPSMKRAARPLNLFENPFPEGYPSIWGLDADWTEGTQKVIALFNFKKETQCFELDSDILGIDDREYIALEWWQGRWLGKFSDALSVEVPPEDVSVIHYVPVKNEPVVVSISHHISGGYILKDVTFDYASGTLSGSVHTKAGLNLVIFGYAPENWRVPISKRAHLIQGRSGQWQMELKTTGKITEFEIKFENHKS